MKYKTCRLRQTTNHDTCTLSKAHNRKVELHKEVKLKLVQNDED